MHFFLFYFFFENENPIKGNDHAMMNPASASASALFFLLLLITPPRLCLCVVADHAAAAFLAVAKSGPSRRATTTSTLATCSNSRLRFQEQQHWSLRLSETRTNHHQDDVMGDIPRRCRLVIVGGGIGGLSSAYDARHILNADDHNVDVTVISNQDVFSFTPSNPWIATRIRRPSDIQLPLDTILPRHGIEFLHAAVTRLEPHPRNRLWLESRNSSSSSGSSSSSSSKEKEKKEHKSLFSLDYDYLIIATGPRLAFDEIPGLAPLITTTTTNNYYNNKKHAITGNAVTAAASICTTPHALHTADLVDALQNNPGPVVVGATQDASCFGPAYEFMLLLHHELMKRGGTALVEACRPLTFVTSEPFVGHLGLNGAGDSRQVMEALLQKHGIEVMTSTRTVQVAPTSITVERLDEATGQVLERKVLPSKLTMLIPPFHGQNVWKRVPHLTDDKGLVLVNEFQQNPTYRNIFAVGVAVSIPNPIPTLLHCGVPKTGYLIESQGTAAIRNIQTLVQAKTGTAAAAAAADKDGGNQKKSHGGNTDRKKNNHNHDNFDVQLHSRPLMNALCITDFGNDGAVFVTLPQSLPRRLDVTIHGKVATLAKIAFEKCTCISRFQF
jgi:NADH dehydrogenase FAD-containing subunit